MSVNDIPPGWLVMAVERAGWVYCLECACTSDGEPLSEDDLVDRGRQQGEIACAKCGEVLYVML